MSYYSGSEGFYICDRCGTLLPGDMMVWLDNGEIYCEDCYDELCREEEEEDVYDYEDSDPVVIAPTGLSPLMQVWFGNMDFLEQLPLGQREDFTREYDNGHNPFENEALMAKTKSLKLRNFNAIDFETANEHPESICSMGIVFVREGKIIEKHYQLIHPEPDYYSYGCQRVHGLGPADTDNKPNFKKAWNKIRNKINHDPVPFVAHNASFDKKCLESALRVYQMEDPGYKFIDTLASSRRWFGPKLPNHQLQTVAAACGYDLRNHHHALADAEACAAIALKTIPISDLLK